MTTAAPVVLVRVPPPGGTGRHKLTKREAATGLFFGLGDRYGTETFNKYRAAAGELRFVAEPSKGQVGDGPASARAVAALQAAGFEVRAHDEEAAARLRAGCAIVGGVVADADAGLERACAGLAERGLVPRPYQRDGIRWVRATRAGALLDDMGLGKTMQILLAFGDRIVIFCPASVKGVWAREAGMWRPDLRPVVLDGVRSNAGEGESCLGRGVLLRDLSDDGGTAACLPGGRCPAPAAGFGRGKVTRPRMLGADAIGSEPRKGDAVGCAAGVGSCVADLPLCENVRGVMCHTIRRLPSHGADVCEVVTVAPRLPSAFGLDDGNRCAGSFRWPNPGEIVILNYDVVTADDIAAAGPCPNGVDGAADEGHVVKNARSNRAKAIKAGFAAIEKVDGRRLLVTATPVCNRPAELKAVLEAVGAFKIAFSSWTAFSKAFGGAIHSAEAKPTEAATVALSRVSLRRTKADVAKDLPSLTIAERRVALEGQAAVLAAEIEGRLRPLVDAAGVEAGDPDATARAIEAALRAGSDIGEMAAARRVLALAKLPAALEVVEECEEAGRPIVLASAHREVCERVAQRPGWALIAGGVDADERTRVVERFQRGELRGVALTIRAGGVGLTLTAAADMVVCDLEWNPALNEQLFARIHRIGQDRPCTVTLLRGDAWIEDRMAELLGHKARMIAGTVDRVAELGGRIAAVPDMAAVAVGPVVAPVLPLAPPVRPAVRPGWIRDPALLARLTALVPSLPGGHVGLWLVRVAGESDGCLPPAVQGRGVRDLVDACERDAAAHVAREREAETERLFHARRALTPQEVHAASALATLADADPDRAKERNGAGFSASTGGPGHRLAGLFARTGVLTPEEWAEAVRIAAHHRAQVGAPEVLPIAA